MTQNNDNSNNAKNVKLSDTFGNEYLTKKVNVRVDETIPKSEQVTVHYKVSLKDVRIMDILGIDFNVRFAATLRTSFNEQNDLLDFANEHATENNPYVIHVNDIGKKIRTPEQRKAELIRAIKAQGYSIEDLEKELNG